MKKPIILIALVILAGAGIWYFSRKMNAHPLAGKKVLATYTGPELMYMGLSTRAGDTVYGTLNADGSMNYVMSGNGIVASHTEFLIPAGNLTNIRIDLPLANSNKSDLISDLEKVFKYDPNATVYKEKEVVFTADSSGNKVTLFS